MAFFYTPEGTVSGINVGKSIKAERNVLMILPEPTVGTTHPSPSSQAYTNSQGRVTLIILERDGSLHHYPSDDLHHSKQASVNLSAAQVAVYGETSIIDKVLDFTFDVLGISNLEMRVYEDQKR